PENMLVIAAYQEGELAAMSFFVKSQDTLYGRYWGAKPGLDVPFLHFELSYYQGVEYCMRHGLKLFEAGAQGEQKLLRGFRPVEILSLHKLSLPPLHQAIERHVLAENKMNHMQMEELKNYL